MTQYVIPPKIEWRRPSAFPALPPAELIDRYVGDDAREKLARYRELAASCRALQRELAGLDPDRAHHADEQARQRAFLDGTEPPAATEPHVRARAEELRAQINTATGVCYRALETAAAAILGERRETLDRVEHDARKDIPARVAALRTQLDVDLDALFELMAVGEWVRRIDITAGWNPARSRRQIDDAFEALLVQLDDEFARTFGPIEQPEPTVWDVQQHYGEAAAKEYAAQARRTKPMPTLGRSS